MRVRPSPTMPVSELGARVIAGASGACVSTLRVSVPEATDVFPAASVAVAVRVCSPSARTGVTAFQRPWTSAVTVARSTSPPDPASNTVTVLPASAAPTSVGVLMRVRPSPTMPVSELGAKTISGASGACVSTMTNALRVDVAPLNTVVTTKSWLPSPRPDAE